MTNVLFYHLPDSVGSLFPVLVTLLERSRQQGLDVLILTRGEAEATPLYHYLAHYFELGPDLSLAAAPAARYSLAWSDDPGDHHGMLINLTDTLPPWFSRFDLLAELICGDEDMVARKREHYRLLRHRGYPLKYRDLTGNLQAFLL